MQKPHSDVLSVQLLSENGTEIISSNIKKTDAGFHIVPSNSLPDGNYIIKVKTDSKTFNYKVIKAGSAAGH